MKLCYGLSWDECERKHKNAHTSLKAFSINSTVGDILEKEKEQLAHIFKLQIQGPIDAGILAQIIIIIIWLYYNTKSQICITMQKRWYWTNLIKTIYWRSTVRFSISQPRSVIISNVFKIIRFLFPKNVISEELLIFKRKHSKYRQQKNVPTGNGHLMLIT